jgi:SAM-dependent methyltransferase
MRVRNKVCDAVDWFDPDIVEVLKNEFREIPRFHRKQWESAMIFLALRQQGFLDTDKVGLAMGAGRELLLYVLVPHVKRLVATDLYDPGTVWETAKTNDPDKFIKADKAFEIDDSKLMGLHMDMRQLEFEDNSFDFCYSNCAIEHIGEDHDFRQHLREVHRVLKNGGLYVCTTEFSYGDETIKNPGSYIFSHYFLSELFAEGDLVCEGDFSAEIAYHRTNYPLPVNMINICHGDEFSITTPLFYELPHVQLLYGKQPFTCAIFLLKKVEKKHSSKPCFIGLEASRQFLEHGVANYRSWLAQYCLELKPFSYLPGGVSRFFANHTAFFAKGASGQAEDPIIFHTDYFWMGSGRRKFEICMSIEPGSVLPPSLISVRVYGHKSMKPSEVTCIAESALSLEGQCEVRADLDVVVDEDYVYAGLGYLMQGHCIFTTIRVLSHPVGLGSQALSGENFRSGR